jgi:hypothetical protein
VTRTAVLLGASNLTLAFPLVARSLRASLETPLTIYAAHGHGRSFGIESSMLGRSLPGICDCRLWDDLADRATAEPLALITDVGNDLLYGFGPEQIREWLDVCLSRLCAMESRVVMTQLPLRSTQQLSRRKYHVFRKLFFPRSRLSYEDMLRQAASVNEAVVELARTHGATLVEPLAEWYGFDPIHVRRSRRPEAWGAILSAWTDDGGTFPLVRPAWWDALRTWMLRPREYKLFGRPRGRRQPVQRRPGGVQLRLY